jgi:quercetin dioxygenase-like cupin family protein
VSDHYTDISIAGNCFVKLMVLSYVGQKIQGHAHTYDHNTLLAAGKVIMRANGQESLIEAPAIVVTPKGVVHEFECVELDANGRAILTCIHPIRDGDTEAAIADPEITQDEAQALLAAYPLTKEG